MPKCVCPLPDHAGRFGCLLHHREMSPARHAECRDKPGYFEVFARETGAVKARNIQAKDPPKPANDGTLCVHRKAWMTDFLCKTCGGTHAESVFGCKLHRRCSQAFASSEIKTCHNCDDFEPKPS